MFNSTLLKYIKLHCPEYIGKILYCQGLEDIFRKKKVQMKI